MTIIKDRLTRDEFNVVVKRNDRVADATWRWEIYAAGRAKYVLRAETSYPTMSEATRMPARPVMCEILFLCPTHRRAIDTGIDEDTLRRTRLNLVHVPCPHCGRMHRFLLADAQVSDHNEYRGIEAA